MTDKTGTVRNPLTVIALFAGIAETSGTVVLPFLNSSIQKIYVYFLMVFPSALVIAFFFVLYRKHEVLYAPSDFADQDHFINLMPARVEKPKPVQDEEVAEVIKDRERNPNSDLDLPKDEPAHDAETISTKSTESLSKFNNAMMELISAENRKSLISYRISWRFGLSFSGPAQTAKLQTMFFDGVAHKDKIQYMLIIEDLFNKPAGTGMMNSFVAKIFNFYKSFSHDETVSNRLIPCIAISEDHYRSSVLRNILNSHAFDDALKEISFSVFIFDKEGDELLREEIISAYT